jgi:hypothetical protein
LSQSWFAKYITADRTQEQLENICSRGLRPAGRFTALDGSPNLSAFRNSPDRVRPMPRSTAMPLARTSLDENHGEPGKGLVNS